jgi:hypothetical protein
MRSKAASSRAVFLLEVSHAIHRFDRPPKHRGTLRRNHRKCADNQGITPAESLPGLKELPPIRGKRRGVFLFYTRANEKERVL